MAVMTPEVTQTIMDTPTELAFSRTPLGLTKIPDPMMFPEWEKKQVDQHTMQTETLQIVCM